jgi:hypothetical protein
MVDFKQNLYMEDHDFAEAMLSKEMKGDIPTSEQISGIEVRLSRVLIKDNKTPRIGPFPGLAKVYFLNFTASDLIEEHVQLDLKGFPKVDDGELLPVDRTLFYWKKEADTTRVPSQIHVMTSLIKSKQDIRNAGTILTQVKEDDDYKSLAKELGTAMKAASQVSNISNIIFSMAGVVGKYLGNVDDKPLLTMYQSFTDIGGDFNQLGRVDKPIENKYVGINLSVYIRDKERQKEAEKMMSPSVATAGPLQ